MNASSKAKYAHLKFKEGAFEEALGLYSEALNLTSLLPQHRIALHSNRAACYLKLQRFKEAVQECSCVLAFDCNHTGALMLWAQALVALKEYHCALFDVCRLSEISPSTEIYRGLEARLKTQLALAPIPEGEEEELCIEKENHKSPPESPSLQFLERSSPTTVLPEEKICPKPTGWEQVPKPKGHTKVDYSRWSNIGDDLSGDDEDGEDSKPQYRYRLRTVGLRDVRS